MKKITISTSILVCLLCIAGITARAQKLPTVQQESVSAPAGIKIDGNPDEWGGQFKAYNKSTGIFYTVANDNNNLYFIIQATNSRIIDKIFGGGITFTIKNQGSDKTVPFSITYPLIPRNSQAPILHPIIGDTSINIADALPDVNKKLEANSKEIAITGCKDIVDSTISVYNEYGIKAAALFNNKRAYTYELAVPLKYFNRSVNDKGALSYNIRLNGMKASNVSGTINGKPIDESNSSQAMALLSQLGAGSGNAAVLDRISATDLSGTYTLAK